jgi:hypothetical protein
MEEKNSLATVLSSQHEDAVMSGARLRKGYALHTHRFCKYILLKQKKKSY